MRRGEFEQAWEICDRVLQSRAGMPCWHRPRHEQYIWNGSAVDGRRVLVRCYHGLGDTIQFIRYAPMLRQRAAEVVVWAQPTLLPVLRSVGGVDRWLPLHDGDPRVECDMDIEAMELPHLFRTTLGTIPREVPYIRVERAVLAPSIRPNVGIVWRAGDWREHRSIPFRLLEPLLHLPAAWYVLQGSPGIEDRPPGFGIVAGTNDPLELAQVMSSLDLVITVDSMTAHLAGALARPVWTLLPRDADWRWMEGRDDSPWYPTMRLFRQREEGRWEDVVMRVRAELARVVTVR